jgi:SAM-dependent methyltransferase
MFSSKTDKDWEKFGSLEPYFGVLSDNKYHRNNLTNEVKEEFFLSGYQHINFVIEAVRKYVDDDFTFRKAIDFGCGVGRLVIPLSEIAEHVVGIDISESMLQEAKKNCDSRNIRNVEFIRFKNDFSELHEKYDFIHSYIVFQHIPTHRGEKIFESLLNLLNHGGIGVLHFTYANSLVGFRNLVSMLKQSIPFINNFINLFKGRNFYEPHMQMNNYNLNNIFRKIRDKEVENLHIEYTNHGGYLGVIIIFRKPERKY